MRPMVCRWVALKCRPALTPLLGPMKLPSRVNEFIRLNSRHITTRLQVSFDFWIAKQLSSKLNMSEFSLYNLQQSSTDQTYIGKIFSLLRSCGFGWLFPYMKKFLPTECA